MVPLISYRSGVNMELQRFEQLGQKLEALLTRVEALGRANAEQRRILEGKEKELQELHGKLATLEEERDQVRVKVDELLDRIDSYVAEEN